MSIRCHSSVLLSERLGSFPSLGYSPVPRHHLLSLADLAHVRMDPLLLPVWLPISPDFSLFVFDVSLSYPRSPPVAFRRSTALIPGQSFGRQFATLFCPSFRGRSIMLTLFRSSTGRPPKHIPRDVHLLLLRVAERPDYLGPGPRHSAA
jgi:hypothetical protein